MPKNWCELLDEFIVKIEKIENYDAIKVTLTDVKTRRKLHSSFSSTLWSGDDIVYNGNVEPSFEQFLFKYAFPSMIHTLRKG